MENDRQLYFTQPKGSCWKRFKKCLWNSETNQCLGRTACGWVKIITFYLCFYIVLAAYTAGLFYVFYLTIDLKVPKWQMKDSLIGSNPGFGFCPMSSGSGVKKPLISFKTGDPDSIKKWVDKIDKFLQPYEKMEIGGNVEKCDGAATPSENNVCFVDIKAFSPCSSDNSYGYTNGTPCIFLKLNKIYNWEPDYYSDQDLPEKMPKDLNSNSVDKTIRVSCEGEKSADAENIGTVQYFPPQGIPHYYYPFKNQDSYLNPLVAVMFKNPKPGVLIRIECKAWAKNIVHDKAENRGAFVFELKMD